MSPPPGQASAKGSDRQDMISDNVRNMNTTKFLHTDLNGYLKQGEHVTCISCQDCVRIKDKLLHYKYNPRL